MKNKKLPLLGALFLFGTVSVYGQNFKTIIGNYLNAGNALGKDITNKEFVIVNEDFSSSMNGTVVGIQQVYNNIPIFGSEASVLVKNNQVSHFSGEFSKITQAENAGIQALNSTDLLATVLKNLNLSDFNFYKNLLDKGEIKTPKKMYFNNGQKLILASIIEFAEKGSHHYWYIVADAKDGKILLKQDLNLSCNFTEDAYHKDYTQVKYSTHDFLQPQTQTGVQQSLLKKAPDNATYNVFAFPVEAPSFGSRSVITNPWDLTASPEGWHSDGTTHYTTSRGNNVYVYTDMDNLNTPQFEVDGGVNRNFDFPLDLSVWPTGSPNTGYTNAALTNLFYVNNKVHDVLYKFGFTETSKNFQKNNFGKGGAQNDPVNAEARDGSGTNNANFNTPSDGTSPRMQMYLWFPSSLPQVFFINAPSSGSSRQVGVGRGYFGAPLYTTPLTADVIVPNVVDGCTPITANSLTGKIAYIQRGDCNFSIKVRNAQDAGAVAAIIANNKVEDPDTQLSNMIGSTDPGIIIPSVFINKVDAAYFNDLFTNQQPVNITLKEGSPVPRDASLDNGIIAHEYGHGLSNRTTGVSVGCLNTNLDNEQMGEGWSDFLALMFTNSPGDNASVPRGIGTYAIFEPKTGLGIRPAKYSPDFNINNYTYGMTNGMTVNGGIDVHSIGFVWATILWDLHWKYVEKYGYASDIAANPTSGSGRVFQTVLNGIKLQGCYPTFVMGRDGILAADQNMTGGDNKCLIWRTFAKRGVGVQASAGSKTSITDQVEDFTVPAECALATNEVNSVKAMSIYPNPANKEFFLNFNKSILGKVSVEIYDASGKLVVEQKVDSKTKEAINTEKLPNGVYVVKVSGMDVNYSTKLIIKK